AGLMRKFPRDYEGGDACRERGRREASEIFPAIELRERSFADDELRRGPDHHGIRVVIETARHAEPPRQEYRQGNLIELGRGPMGRAVHEPVLKPRAVGALAPL